MAYPAEPWRLAGRMRVSVFAVPVPDLPAIPADLAGAVRVVRLAGRALVGVAWVEYGPGSVLEYHELLAAVLMRAGVRPRVTITGIWVDSVASLEGGRALWGIPKELARFAYPDDDHARAGNDDGPLAAATVQRGRRLPGRWPLGFRLTQSLHSRPKTSRVRATARLALGRADWSIPPGGPLGFLAGRRPLVTATLADFRMTFGEPPGPT